jgi:phosphotransferase family enzyme
VIAADQQALLDRWLPGATVVRHHSWGLVGNTVLELLWDGGRYIAKAGGPDDNQVLREVHAHRNWLTPLTSIGRAPRFVAADEDVLLLVTRYLPGELVLGHAAELLPSTYRQAGELLARLHAQFSVVDKDFEAKANTKALARLDRPHRIEPDVTARLKQIIKSWPTPPTTLVPTHGDWQPRNWVVHEGVVSAIDFGHAALRPAMTDFARMAARQFRTDPALESAFVQAYGDDPRDLEAWQRLRLRTGIGNATWAYQVGDEAFERQGHQEINEALTAF